MRTRLNSDSRTDDDRRSRSSSKDDPSRTTTSSSWFGPSAGFGCDEEVDTLCSVDGSEASVLKCLLKLNITCADDSGSSGTNASNNNYYRIINPQQITDKVSGRVSFPLLLDLIRSTSSFVVRGGNRANQGENNLKGTTDDTNSGGNMRKTTSNVWCTYQDQDGNDVLIATSEELCYAIKTQGVNEDDILNLDVKVRDQVTVEETKKKKHYYPPPQRPPPPPPPFVPGCSSYPIPARSVESVGMDVGNSYDYSGGWWNNLPPSCHGNHHHHHYDLSTTTLENRFQETLSTSLQAMESRLLTKLVERMEDSILHKHQQGMKDLLQEELQLLLKNAKFWMTSPHEDHQQEQQEEQKDGGVVSIDNNGQQQDPHTTNGGGNCTNISADNITGVVAPQTTTDHPRICPRKKGLQQKQTTATTNQEDLSLPPLPSAQAIVIQPPTNLQLATTVQQAGGEELMMDTDAIVNLMEQGIAAASTNGLEEVTMAECHWVHNDTSNTTTATTSTGEEEESLLIEHGPTSHITTNAQGPMSRRALKTKIHHLERINGTLLGQLEEARQQRQQEDKLKETTAKSLVEKEMEIQKLQNKIAFRRVADAAAAAATTSWRTTTAWVEEEKKKNKICFQRLAVAAAAAATRRTKVMEKENRNMDFQRLAVAAAAAAAAAATRSKEEGRATTGVNSRSCGNPNATSAALDKYHSNRDASHGKDEEDHVTTLPKLAAGESEAAETRTSEEQQLVGILSESVIPVLKSSIFQKMSHYNDKRVNGLKELKDDIECCTNLTEGWNKTILDGIASQSKSLKNRLNDRTEKIVRRITQLEACCSDINNNNSKRASESQKVAKALETMQKEQANLRRDIKTLIKAIVKEADSEDQNNKEDDDESSSSGSSSTSSSSSSSSSSFRGTSSSSKSSDGSVYTSVPGSIMLKAATKLKNQQDDDANDASSIDSLILYGFGSSSKSGHFGKAGIWKK